jgi:geranylgeranyl pyrophosphate synthase
VKGALGDYLTRVAARVDEALAHPSFHPHQRALLEATVAVPRARAARAPLGDPLSLTYLIARAHGREMDAQAEHVGAFCTLYVLSLDLFDDVQDEDLAGKPHEGAGPALAINGAITLGFLATDQLRRALELERDPDRRLLFLRLFNRVSLEAAAGQHRDLLGAGGARTPDEVLSMHQAKTSSVALLAECGALLGGSDGEAATGYRAFGEQMARFVQVRDDLRDVFGKALSPDLATGKISYPVACLLSEADEITRTRFHDLVAGLPATMKPLRRLIYRAAVTKTATKLEELRRGLHENVAATKNASAEHRTLLDVVDGLAQSIYAAPPIAVTAHLWRPAGAWHDQVRRAQQKFVRRIGRVSSSFGEAPALRPWHRPHWMYVPARRTIFYPDVEGLPGEVLPFPAELLGSADLREVAQVVEKQLPLVVAHEMFHFLRHARGRLTTDHWHEEWAANRLAVAYARHFEPAALAASLELADRVLSRFPERLDEHAETLLMRSKTPWSSARGYEVDVVSVAVVTLEMVRRLSAEAPVLSETISALLDDHAALSA